VSSFAPVGKLFLLLCLGLDLSPHKSIQRILRILLHRWPRGASTLRAGAQPPLLTLHVLGHRPQPHPSRLLLRTRFLVLLVAAIRPEQLA
jgi:hypothetical protein